MATVDIEAYCKRIDLDGQLVPTRDVMAEVVRKHVSAIPFENVDVLLGREIDISPGEIAKKIIGDRRGG
jgi:N-hydroxyarylamine O-acetyltransferase